MHGDGIEKGKEHFKRSSFSANRTHTRNSGSRNMKKPLLIEVPTFLNPAPAPAHPSDLYRSISIFRKINQMNGEQCALLSGTIASILNFVWIGSPSYRKVRVLFNASRKTNATLFRLSGPTLLSYHHLSCCSKTTLPSKDPPIKQVSFLVNHARRRLPFTSLGACIIMHNSLLSD